MSQVDLILGLKSERQFAFSIDRIARGTDADIVLDCPAASDR